MGVKHQHFMYMIGLQPKQVVEFLTRDKYDSCPQTLNVEALQHLGIFTRITGSKRFCTYVLVYHNGKIKAASDHRIRIPRVLIPMKDLVNSQPLPKIVDFDLVKFVSSTFVPAFKLEELDNVFKTLEALSNALLPTDAGSSADVIPPSKKIKKVIQDGRHTLHSITRGGDAYLVDEEDTRNRLVLQKLFTLVEAHGYGIVANRLKGFTLPITEFGRSRNDHCLIHYESFFKMEKLSCGVVVAAGLSTQFDMEEGNVAAGVVKFKNDDFGIDQCIAEMLRTSGDLVLHVLSDKKQILLITIIGLAVNYKTGNAKMIEMEIDLIEETSVVKQVREALGFDEALNAMLHIIRL